MDGEDEDGEGTEGEDVGGARVGVGEGQDLGGEVEVLVTADVLADVPGSGLFVAGGRCCGGGAGGGVKAGGRLPVADLEAWSVGGAGDDDRAGGEGAVVQAVAVGAAEALGEEADQVEPLGQSEGVGVLGQPVVQPGGLGVVGEDHGRAGLGGDEVAGPVDGGVVDALEEGDLALGGGDEGGAFLVGGGLGEGVEADPLVGVGEVGVGGLEVLPVLPLVQELAEGEVADLAGLGRAADARLLHGLGDHGRGGPVDLLAEAGVELGEVGHEAVERWVLVEAEDVVSAVGGELAGQVLGVEEHRGLEVGEAALERPGGAGVLELGLELLGLEVGQVERVVQRLWSGVLRAGPAPLAGVPLDQAGVALELDQDHAGRGDDQQVDLVEAPAGVGEGEVRPRAVGLGLGQALLEVVEALPLVRELRWRHLDPHENAHPSSVFTLLPGAGS